MSVGTHISLTAAVLQLAFAATFLVLARAPGWRHARVYALLAFSAACYSMVDIVFTVPGFEAETLRRLTALNYLFGAINCALWLAFAFAHPEQRWHAVPRWIRAVMAVTLALGVISQVPGVLHRDGVIVFELPSIGTTYTQAVATPIAGLIGAWFLIVLTIVVGRFVVASRHGEAGARVQLAGFAVFFGCAIVEVLITNHVIEFVFPADLGFLAVVAAMLVETLRRLVADAHRLADLSRDLTSQVESRTRERDAARDALTHAERLAAVGQLAAGAGHEINNPLTVVRGSLELLRENPDLPDRAELIADALDGAERIARVVADLRAYALPDSDNHELIDLDLVLGSARKLASHQLRHVATVVEELGVTAEVRANPTRLSQVFVNLLVNAGQALEVAHHAAPRITIRTRAVGARVEIEIADNGCGIAADALARLGEPYFSTRVNRGGTGLGLFMVRGILTSLGGTLTFTSTVGVGTTAVVSLPAVTAARLAAIAPPPIVAPIAAPTAAAIRLRVLVVDDEPTVASAAARLLHHLEVTIARSGDEAIALVDGGTRFDAILCDLMMPGGSGIDVHAALAARHPELLPRLVFLTGGAVTAAAREFLERPGVRCVEKPFDRATLVATVTEVSAATARRTARRRGPDTLSASRPAR